MRILSVSTLFPNPARPSFGVFVGNQMRAVAARGDIDLTMISPLGLPPWPLSRDDRYARLRAIPDEAEMLGLRVLYPRFTLIPRLGADSNPRRILRAIAPLVGALHARQPFDLIDASFFFPDGPVAAALGARLGLPVTIKARGADIHYWGNRPRARRQMLDAARQARALLAVSAALREDMAALGMPKDRIHLHYTGLDRSRFSITERRTARQEIAADARLAIPADGPLLVTPGALIPRKGQRLALDALAWLPEARLVFAGAGEDEAELRKRARDLGLSQRVHLAGLVPHDRLPMLLCAADVVVLPSESEGLANVWVEALACGTPLVIPDIGGAREVVTSPTAGRIAARDGAAIADAVAALLADPPAQEAVAANAAAFSWDRNAGRIAAIWRGCLTR